jgi:hypothetical protein
MTLLLSVLPELQQPYHWWRSNPDTLEVASDPVTGGFWLDKSRSACVFFRVFRDQWQADTGGSPENTTVLARGTLEEVLASVLAQLRLGLSIGAA